MIPIEWIAYVIAALGIVLVGILLHRVFTVDRDMKLKQHRAKDAGLADLLIHAAMVDDGVIVGKNGSLMAAWIYKAEDNASSTEEQREKVAMQINKAFVGLGNGWMVHVDAVRRPASNYSQRELSHFPDPLTEAMDEERRRLFEGLGVMYEGYFVLTLTYYPPMLAQQKFVELMFDDDAPPLDHKARTLGLIQTFKNQIGGIEGALSSVLEMTRLKGNKVELEDGRTVTYDDFLAWLQFCITGISQPILLPSNPMYLDCLIGGQELWAGTVPRVGRKFVQCVAIEGFPLESAPGLLADLAELPVEYRWSSRFIFMDTVEAVKHLEKFRKKWKQKVRGFFDQVFNTNSGNIDQDALSMVEDASGAIADVNSGLVAQGYYTSVVVLMDESRDRLDMSARAVEKAVARLGFGARIETINTLDAYLGSIPGHGVENVRRPLINTLNLADLLPTSTVWTGEDKAPCPFYPPSAPPLMHCVTHGSTPFRLNLHVRDVGHSLMFGPIGAGKSTHLGILAAQFRRYTGMNVFAFDKGMSLFALAAGINTLTKGRSGLHFNVGGDDSTLSFCPLQFLETKSDRAWAMEWIDTILALNGVVSTPEQRNEIGYAIMDMHKTGARTLSEFTLAIQDENIRQALAHYTVDGQMGHLLDAENDSLTMSDFTVFEIEELLMMGDKWALPVLLYLFRRIERSLKGQPTVIILDEAWIMLGHPVFKEKIKEWLKVLRKANCAVVLATQSISDATNSGILTDIVESTATKIFLPNVQARDDESNALYRRMGLNSRQIEIIASATPKREYYYTSENGRRLYNLALGPLALAFIGVSDKEGIATIKALRSKFGDAWIKEWLAMRGLSLADYGVAA